MIVCIRTVRVPAASRERYADWIRQNRGVRQEHGILFELVLEEPASSGDCVVITAWPSDEAFDAWIATPERAGLTASEVHQSVTHEPIVRHEVAAGYFNMNALRKDQML